MNSIYLISVIVLVRLFFSSFKKNNDNSNKIIHNNAKTEDSASTILSKEIPLELGKNKWLHPDDEFIKFKKTKHYKSQTFEI